MKTGLLFVILMLGPAFSGFSQDRKETGRERDPGVTTSTRSKSPVRQDASDSPGAKPRDPSKAKTPASKPARSETRTPPPEKSPEARKVRVENEPEVDPAVATDAWDEGMQAGQTSGPSRKEHQKVFDDVRNGLNSGNIASFSELLGPQVHVNLRGGESGYFSSSQAYYVLEKYLRSNKFSGLHYGTMDQSGDTPFATGKADLDQKGMKEAAQVYVSLTKAGGRWVISQIKIY